MSQHVGLQRRLACPQLAPSDFAIAVPVQADREFAVTNRELQRPGHLSAGDLQTKESIAGNVGLGHGSRQCQRELQRQHPQQFAKRVHREATEAVVPAFTRTSRRPWVRTKSSAGSAAAGLPAAFAAFTSTSTSSGSACTAQFSIAPAKLSFG